MRWPALLALALALVVGAGCGGTIGVGGGPSDDQGVAVVDALPDGPPCEGTPASCGPPGACVSCAGNPAGSACVQSGCGCNTPADCAGIDRTCIAGRCAAACTDFMACTTGCCNGAYCAPGNTSKACGATGSKCVDCSANALGHACLGGKCGCSQASDCPPLTACNGGTAQCESACSATQPCSSGCCSAMANGTCLDGKSNQACGNSGAVCTNCGPLNLECSGVTCGCTRAADCLPGKACDLQTKKCVTACNANQLCNGGCCMGGTCAAGNDNAACGSGGGACAPCTDGKPTCVSGVCEGRCGGMGDGTCGGGTCCSAGQCVAGNVAKSCGYSGACADCSNLSSGNRCLAPMNSKMWVCGCAAKEDCPAANPAGGIGGYACDVNNGSCTNTCGVPGVTNCNGGCCSGASGQCRAGNADAACGNNGGYCSNCANTCSPAPTCNVATGACGCTMARGQCNLSIVCSMNNANRYGCNLTTHACCVPGFYNYPDNGNAAGCCSGQSAGGKCSCFTDGVVSGNPANPWACCSLDVDAMGKCKCLVTGANAEFSNGAGGVASACCSNRLNGVVCACSPVGGTCQNNAGCCNMNCVAGVCK